MLLFSSSLSVWMRVGLLGFMHAWREEGAEANERTTVRTGSVRLWRLTSRLSVLEIIWTPCVISNIRYLDNRPPLQAPTGLHSCPVLSCAVLPCPVLSCPILSCPVLSCPLSLPPSEGYVRQVRQVRRGEAGRLLLHRPSLPITAYHLLVKHQHSVPPPSRPRIYPPQTPTGQ